MSGNIEKISVNDLDELSAGSSVMGRLQLAITVTKVNGLCTEGNVVNSSINDELKTRKISRELFLTIQGQKVNSEMKKSVPDWQELREKVKKTIDDKLKLIFIKNAQEEKMIVSYNDVNRVIINSMK